MISDIPFEMPGNAFKHREPWLHAVADRMRPMFAIHGATIPAKIRFSCGFPSTRGLATKAQHIGQCWSHECSADGHAEIFISPVVDNPMRVAGVLAHELVHAIVGVEARHRGPFAKLAKAIGLEGKMSATTEGEAFKLTVAPILDAVGPYPHGELSEDYEAQVGNPAAEAAMPGLRLHGADHPQMAR